MEAIAARDEVAGQFARDAVLAEANRRRAGSEVVNADVLHLEVKRAAARLPRLDEIAHDFVLAVNGYPAAAGQRRHVDAMASTVERQVDAVVTQALARQAPADANLAHE